MCLRGHTAALVTRYGKGKTTNLSLEVTYQGIKPVTFSDRVSECRSCFFKGLIKIHEENYTRTSIGR